MTLPNQFAPNSVTGLNAVVNTVHSVTLSWTNQNPGFEAGAVIDRTTPGQPTNFMSLASVAAGVSSYTDTTAMPGGNYNYRVTALPLSSPFVPAQAVLVSATTPGIPPHVYLQTPRIDPGGFQGFIGHKIVTDGSDGHPL